MKRREAVQEIQKEFERKRRAAQKRLEEKKTAIYQRFPQLEEVEKAMTRKALLVTRAMLAEPNEQAGLLHELEAELKSLKTRRQTLMKEYRLTDSDFDPRWECNHCQDKGVLPDGTRCTCFQQALITRAYEMSNLADILQRENFYTFQAEVFSSEKFPGETRSPREHMTHHVWKECRRFVTDFRSPEEKNLLFYGPTGLGKTFMANCIAKALLDKGHTVIYQTAIQLMDSLRDHFFAHDSRDRDSEHLNQLFFCDLLIIDDLGTELANTFTNSQLFQLVNTRMLQGKKTLVSTNLPPSALMERYDDRICSRFFSHYQFIKFYGPDVRWEVQSREADGE